MFIIFMLLGGPANLRQQLKDFTGWNILQISIRAGEGKRETAENGFFRGSKSVFGFFSVNPSFKLICWSRVSRKSFFRRFHQVEFFFALVNQHRHNTSSI